MTDTSKVSSRYLPQPGHIHHGRTPAAWVGVAIAFLGFVLISVGIVLASTVLVLVSLGVLLLSLIAVGVLRAVGLGGD